MQRRIMEWNTSLKRDFHGNLLIVPVSVQKILLRINNKKKKKQEDDESCLPLPNYVSETHVSDTCLSHKSHKFTLISKRRIFQLFNVVEGGIPFSISVEGVVTVEGIATVYGYK